VAILVDADATNHVGHLGVVLVVEVQGARLFAHLTATAKRCGAPHMVGVRLSQVVTV